jgi:DNA-binding transcriptional LysR family regulator
MEDHRLKSYCLVVETKSFSRAAQAKHMTQSAMSRLVKSLEEELGVTLLLRKGRTVAPTPEGRLFYEHARKILEDYAKLEQDISAATRQAKGALRLGASRTPAVHLLPQVIYDFSKAHPAVRIDLSVDKTAKVLQDLRDGKIDIGIVEGNVGDSTFFAEVIAEDEIVLIAPENHPLTRKKTAIPQDLVAEPFLLPDQGSGTRELVDAYLREAGIDAKKIKVRMTIGSPELIIQMVRAGLGLAFASKWAVFAGVKEGTVKIVKMPGQKLTRNLFLLRIEGEPAPAAREFRQFMKQYRFFIPF